MSWQTVLDVIDAIESWVAGQSYWIQVALLLAVLGPLCYLLAGLIDRIVEAAFAWHGRRDRQGGLAPGGFTAGKPSPTAGQSVSTAGEPSPTVGESVPADR
ncbi:MAG: hypothetical protein ABWZ02_07650 [Nakamurella sp.]